MAAWSSSEDWDERFVGGVGVGLSCMQCSHGYIQYDQGHQRLMKAVP